MTDVRTAAGYTSGSGRAGSPQRGVNRAEDESDLWSQQEKAAEHDQDDKQHNQAILQHPLAM